MNAILIAAPQSGSGKTTVTLALLRALAKAGHPVRSIKLGPDYIDPAFHEAATGQPALNLDAWAMNSAGQNAILAGDGPLVIESAMGLFDGAGLKGRASAAEVAKTHNLPVLLVVDCARQSHSIAALIHGFTQLDPAIRFHGVVLNNVGSDRHEGMLRQALADQKLPVLAALRRDKSLTQPSRHLGLVQAQERDDLNEWLDRLATWISRAVDVEQLLSPWTSSGANVDIKLRPPAQRISIAQDAAFSFMYPHLLREWQKAGAEITLFSPLNDDPVPDCDLVFLPGGYPELHAGRIAINETFLSSIKVASEDSEIYGECGGYMVLGNGLIDGAGQRHKMAGLLCLETSFEHPARHLGYRELRSDHGPFSGAWRGHEFHHSNTLSAIGDPLFTACDADGMDLQPMGLRQGRVSGSYAHIIAPLDDPTGQA